MPSLGLQKATPPFYQASASRWWGIWSDWKIPWTQTHCHSLIGNNDMWNIITKDKTFCTFTNSGCGKNLAVQESKFPLSKNLFTQEQKTDLPWWSNVSYQSLTNYPRECCHLGDSDGLFCCQSGYSKVVIARSFLVSGCSCCWDHAQPLSCFQGHIALEPMG
jgi:hypothetical protein